MGNKALSANDRESPIQNATLVTRSPGTPKSEPPQEGSLGAWLQVLAAFALYWNSLGLVNGFGAFQTYYSTSMLSHESSSAISWIGSVQVFFLMAGGVFFGPLYDLGYVRSMLFAGAFLVGFGFLMTSICTQYYQILLAQGFCIGIGTSCLYVPAITLIPAHFTTKRTFAMSIASVGSSLGAVTYPLMFELLQPRIGFGWTVRAIGSTSLVISCLAVVVARPRRKAKSSKLFLLTSPKGLIKAANLTDTRYIVQCLAIFFSNLAFFEPLYYLQTFAESHGMQSQHLTKYLLIILNGVALLGRILPSFIIDRLGLLNTYTIVCSLTAVSVFYWISVDDRASNIAFTVLYGFFSASVVTLAPVVLTSISDDLDTLGTRLGVVAVLKGIGSLIGPPIAGAILRRTGSFLGVQLFTGLSFTFTAIFAGQLGVIIARLQGSVRGDAFHSSDETD